METVQIVIDKDLLRAADQAARQTKRNRSALIRDALREHLRRLRVRDAEECDRVGYGRQPQGGKESLTWEPEAVWPAE
jgi:metal-responsive CopG/Arc/MetJ family transcriptional regulator